MTRLSEKHRYNENFSICSHFRLLKISLLGFISTHLQCRWLVVSVQLHDWESIATAIFDRSSAALSLITRPMLLLRLCDDLQLSFTVTRCLRKLFVQRGRGQSVQVLQGDG